MARKTLEIYLRERRFAPFKPENEGLRQKGGAFVTLESRGELRGCIGHLAADKPLFLTVQEMAIQAATGDPRFPPVAGDELVGLEIEISVLSAFERVSDISRIRIGEHGLMISEQGARKRSGLLLPQVATRWGWDSSTFLSAACRKAGLALDAWRKREIAIEIFTADVFSEREMRA